MRTRFSSMLSYGTYQAKWAGSSGISGRSTRIIRPSCCSGVLISSGSRIAYAIGSRRTTFFGRPNPYFTCQPPVIVTIRFPSPRGLFR